MQKKVPSSTPRVIPLFLQLRQRHWKQPPASLGFPCIRRFVNSLTSPPEPVTCSSWCYACIIGTGGAGKSFPFGPCEFANKCAQWRREQVIFSVLGEHSKSRTILWSEGRATVTALERTGPRELPARVTGVPDNSRSGTLPEASNQSARLFKDLRPFLLHARRWLVGTMGVYGPAHFEGTFCCS